MSAGMSEEGKDADITPEEMEKIHKALQDEKFRELFFDYCKEISDPENKAKYEMEISQLEKERGFDVTFVKPEAGHVIKVIDQTQNKKLFINVCTSTNAAKATVEGGNQKKGSAIGENWSVPHIINKPRDDADKAGNPCIVCDIVFHPEIYENAKKQPNMMKMLNNIALDSVQEKFRFKIDRNNVKYPKLKFKGRSEASVIRSKTADGPTEQPQSIFVKYPEPLSDSFNADTELKAKETKKVPQSDNKMNGAHLGEKNSRTIPRCKIVHRGHFDIQDYTLASDAVVSTRPAELCLEIELPMASSAAGIDLDVFEKRVVLDSRKPNYYLDLTLPYPVDEDKGRAQFDKSRKVLVVTLPVLPPTATELNSLQNARKLEQISRQHCCEGDGDSSCAENRSSQDEKENKSLDLSSRQDDIGTRAPEDVGLGTDNSTGSQQVDGTGKPSSSYTHSDHRKFKEKLSVAAESNNNITASRSKSANSQSLEESEYSADEKLMTESSESFFVAAKKMENHPDKALALQSDALERDNGELTGESNVVPIARVEGDMMGEVAEHIGYQAENIPCESEPSLPHTSMEKQAEPFGDADVRVEGERDSSEKGVSSFGSISLEFANMPDIAGMYKLPPYSYDQNEETITVNINISNVKMENVSMGFSSRKVYFSVVTEASEDVESTRWCILLKFLEYCHLDPDQCSIDVEEDRVVLLLQKTEDSFGLWNKFFVGSSEKSLEELFFLTDHSMSELFERIRDTNDLWAKKNLQQEDEKEEESEFAKKQLEASLEQLLREQGIQDIDQLDIDGDEIGNVGLGDVKFGYSESNFGGDQESKDLDGVRSATNGDSTGLGSLEIHPKASESGSTESNENKKQHKEQSSPPERDSSKMVSSPDSKEASKPHDCRLTLQESDSVAVTHLTKSSSQESGDESEAKSVLPEVCNGDAKLSSSSDIILDICQEELQDDVIDDSDSPRCNKYMSRAPIERSRSEETPTSSLELRSILKRSPNGSTNEDYESHLLEELDCGTLPEVRPRSRSFNVDTRPTPRDKVLISRNRNKSVSFDLEPKVCEFIEYSKKQMKKMRKQERKQMEIEAKKLEARNSKGNQKNKHGKYQKGGKNKNFFNEQRKVFTSSSEEIYVTSPKQECKKKDKSKAKKTGKAERPDQDDDAGSNLRAVNEEPDSGSVKEVAGLDSKIKDGNHNSEGDKGVGKGKTESSNGKLLNPLIYELDS